MSNLNLCVVEGHLAGNPEVKYLSNGTCLCKFSVAANSIFGKGRNAKEEVAFFNVTTWGKLGESCGKYLTKGSHVLLSGNLKQSRWTDKNGANRSNVFIQCRDIRFLPKATGRKTAA